MSKDSDVYRQKVANYQTHTFSLTSVQLNKALKTLIEAYFPDASPATKKKALAKCQAPMHSFIKNVGDKLKRTSKTSEGIHSIKITPRSITAVFDATGTNRFGKIYAQYARDQKYLQAFTEECLDILGSEFGAVPAKETKKGKIVNLKAGEIFNLEHGHERGILESLLKDAVDNAVLSSQKYTKADVTKFLKANDVDVSIIRNTKTDQMDVFLGSKIINTAEGMAAKQTKAKLQKALLNAIKTLESSGKNLSYMKGSPSFVDVKESQAKEAVLDSFRKKKNHKVSRTKKAVTKKTTTANKISVGKSLGTPLAAKAMRKRKSQKEKSAASSTLQLVASLNKALPSAVAENMRSPALNYQTGRFATSVQVTDVSTTNKGFPSIGYTYDRGNYEQYESSSGTTWASVERDPRKLIDASIREIARPMAIGRFFTRRT